MARTTHDYGIPDGTVAVGVDGSPCSDAALDEAVRTAAVEHRSLTIIHAVESSSLTQGVLTDARETVVRRAPGLEVHLVLRVEDPRDLLVAASERAAVLVVGSRGRGPVRSMLLGSVSLSVSRRASCAVVVVRPHHPGLVRHGVLVGADATIGSLPTLDFAFRRASSRGLPLTLTVSESMAGMRENHPGVAVRVEVVRGHPVHVLVRMARQMDLLVVGAPGGGSAVERALHSVAVSVVERALCPVAVVPTAPAPVVAHG